MAFRQTKGVAWASPPPRAECNGGFGPVASMVVDQANLLLRLRRLAPIRDSHFFSRFLSRHPELRKACIKPVQLARKGYEVALHDVNSFFDHVEASQTKGARLPFMGARISVLLMKGFREE